MPQTPDATPAAPTQPPAPGEDKEAQLRIVADDERDQPEPGSDADLKKKLLVTMEDRGNRSPPARSNRVW